MNKKIFGIKIGTYLTVLGCLACAVIVWLFAKISAQQTLEAALALPLLKFIGIA